MEVTAVHVLSDYGVLAQSHILGRVTAVADETNHVRVAPTLRQHSHLGHHPVRQSEYRAVLVAERQAAALHSHCPIVVSGPVDGGEAPCVAGDGN